MPEANKNRPEWDGDYDLYIGVKNDLSPYTVDLKALTRGLVVVGQSGCGKSFMLGRLVEEIVRKTEKSRILIIDPNSDFCFGIELMEFDEFEQKLEKYCSGLLEKEYRKFCMIETNLYKTLLDNPKIRSKAKLFGLKSNQQKYLLSWEELDLDERGELLSGITNDFRVLMSLVSLESAVRSITDEIKKDKNNHDLKSTENVQDYFDSFDGYIKVIKYLFAKELYKNATDDDDDIVLKNSSFRKGELLLSKDANNYISRLKLLNLNEITNFFRSLYADYLWRTSDDDKSLIGLPEVLKQYHKTNSNLINIIDLEDADKIIRNVIIFYTLKKLLSIITLSSIMKAP